MTDFLELRAPLPAEIFPLSGGRITVGRSPECTLVLTNDKGISRHHAVLDNVGGGWTIRDLGSRNGTFVNGEQLVRERALRHSDNIEIGSTRLVFHCPEHQRDDPTVASQRLPIPDLTRREREVLLELCRSKLSGEPFAEAASVRQIAARLFVTEDAIKQHLLRLYDKFGILEDEGERRRARLAREAIVRGAVRPDASGGAGAR